MVSEWGWTPISQLLMLLGLLVFLTRELGVVRVSLSSLHGGSASSLQRWLSRKICAGWDTRKVFHREYRSLPRHLLHMCPVSTAGQAQTQNESEEIYADTWFRIWKCWGPAMTLSTVGILFLNKTSTYFAGKSPSFQTSRAFQWLTLKTEWV